MDDRRPIHPDGAFYDPAHDHDVERLREQLLRVSAELENVRKRTQRELEEQQKYAEQKLLTDLLPIVDGLRQAIDAAEIAGDSAEMIRGVQLIYGQLLQVLAQHHCQAIGKPGEPFDPYRHEAVRKVYAPDEPPDTVLDVVQLGFQLHDRVLRPAKVLVCSPPVA